MEYYLEINNRDPLECVLLAQAAEQAGFDGVTIPDHLCIPADTSDYPYSADGAPPFELAAAWPDVWVTIGAMASVTSRLRFRTAVYVLALRHPIVAARAVSTVASLAPGRVDLGVGAGWLRSEFEALGVDFRRRGALTDEAILAVKELLAGEATPHAGTAWRWAPVHLSPTPPAPVPVFIGGTSGAALRRAARLGDGYIAPPLTCVDSLLLRQRLETVADDVGRPITRLRFHARPVDAKTSGDYESLAGQGIDSVGMTLRSERGQAVQELARELQVNPRNP